MLTFNRAGTFDLVVRGTGAVCSNGGGPSVIFGGKFVPPWNSTLGGVGVVLVDQDDRTIDGILDESSISSPDFATDNPDGSADGSDDGPFPFTLLPLFKFIFVAEANAADGEPEDVGEEDDVFGALVLIAPGR